MMSDENNSDETNNVLAEVMAALTAAGDVAYLWDIESDVIRWFGMPATLGLGDAAGLATGRLFSERVNPDDLPLRRQRLDAHFGGGGDFDCEYRVRTESGIFAWLHDRGAAEFDANGQPRRVLGVLRLVTGRKIQEERLEYLVNYDDLTGHFNKKRLRESLDHVLSASLRSGAAGTYLAVGIDKLAAINDAFGYRAADAVIIEIGQRLDRCLRVCDVIGRVGGDRYGIVMSTCDEHRIAAVAEKILVAVNDVPIETHAGPVYATVSIGSATFPEQAKTSYDVMTRAETALAEAKRAGRDCFVPYRMSEEQRHRHRAGMTLGETVQRALKENRLAFAYQPVIDSGTGVVNYYECLLRMIGEDGAIIPAAQFVPVIEQLGFIRVIDRYVLEMAVDEVTAHPGYRLGFNISGLTATDRSWLRAVTSMLKDKPSISQDLVIEITETAALYDLDESARFVGTLRELGCRVALDDFGAGFTSLRHLQALTVDTVKIDGSFVRNLVDSHDNQVFLRHLVGLANGFDLLTVAECVETPEEAAILRREGVGFLQGYHFGRPLLEKPWLAAAAGSTATRPLALSNTGS